MSMKKKKIILKHLFDNKKNFGETKLGLASSYVWQNDPRRLFISLSRYKFVSKMLEGKKNVLEIGGDSFRNRLVKQVVNNLTVIHPEREIVVDARKNNSKTYKVNHYVHNILEKPFRAQGKNFDAVYSLDVLNNIKKRSENLFIKNSIYNLKNDGVYIAGMPSLESKKYASKISKLGHVNLKSGDKLRQLFEKYFYNVFLFSMNDEVIHTGFFKMAHYIIVLCSEKK
tara:strand:- start:13414 stop:14094 length:681 start_codon:yes stop_codon:yes gene_type:complete